jgi:hypothetical protein
MGKSHQRGWVVARGKKWYGYYRRTMLAPVTNAPVTDVVAIVLGLKARLVSRKTSFNGRLGGYVSISLDTCDIVSLYYSR